MPAVLKGLDPWAANFVCGCSQAFGFGRPKVASCCLLFCYVNESAVYQRKKKIRPCQNELKYPSSNVGQK